MTDDRHDADELVSAYLAAELDAAQTAAFERRLAHDPALRARVDALADALVALRGHDEVEEPAGLARRLEERLAVEGRQVAGVASMDDRREQRAQSTRWWAGIGAAAAVVAVSAVMAAGVLRDVGGGAGDAGTTAADSAQSAGGADTGAGPPSVPVVVDDQAVVDDEEALRDRFTALPEVEALLGTPLSTAGPLADEYASVVRDHVSLSGSPAGLDAGEPEPAPRAEAGGESAEATGDEAATESAAQAPVGAAADCLATITQDAPSPVVPARVETLRYRGEPAVAYVVVTAGPRSQRLNRTEVWVMRPDDCSTITFQQL